MQKNGHLQEMQHIKKELMYVYRRNGGSISRNYIVGLIWDILIDAARYLYSLPTANGFGNNYNLPKTRLYCRIILVSENSYVHPMETPGK